MKTIELNGKTYLVQININTIGKIESVVSRALAHPSMATLTVKEIRQVLFHVLRDEQGKQMRIEDINALTEALGYRRTVEATAEIFKGASLF